MLIRRMRCKVGFLRSSNQSSIRDRHSRNCCPAITCAPQGLLLTLINRPREPHHRAGNITPSPCIEFPAIVHLIKDVKGKFPCRAAAIINERSTCSRGGRSLFDALRDIRLAFPYHHIRCRGHRITILSL